MWLALTVRAYLADAAPMVQLSCPETIVPLGRAALHACRKRRGIAYRGDLVGRRLTADEERRGKYQIGRSRPRRGIGIVVSVVHLCQGLRGADECLQRYRVVLVDDGDLPAGYFYCHNRLSVICYCATRPRRLSLSPCRNAVRRSISCHSPYRGSSVSSGNCRRE